MLKRENSDKFDGSKRVEKQKRRSCYNASVSHFCLPGMECSFKMVSSLEAID